MKKFAELIFTCVSSNDVAPEVKEMSVLAEAEILSVSGGPEGEVGMGMYPT